MSANRKTINQELLKTANQFFRNGDYKKAIEIYIEATYRYPSIAKSILPSIEICETRLRAIKGIELPIQILQARSCRSHKQQSQPKIAIYTANVGNYDNIVAPSLRSDNISHIVFTDQELRNASMEAKKLSYGEKDPTRLARFAKTHPHTLLRNFDVTVWVDGNVEIKPEFLEFLHSVSACPDLLLFRRHPARQILIDEARKCLELRKDNFLPIIDQYLKYVDLGVASNCPLFETNVIIRSNKSERVSLFNEEWWKQILNGSRRDQLSVGYAALKSNIEYGILPENSDIRNSKCNFYSLSPHIFTGPGSNRDSRYFQEKTNRFRYQQACRLQVRSLYHKKVLQSLTKLNELGLEDKALIELKELSSGKYDAKITSNAQLALATEFLSKGDQTDALKAHNLLEELLAHDLDPTFKDFCYFAKNEAELILKKDRKSLAQPSVEYIDFVIQRMHCAEKHLRVTLLNEVFCYFGMAPVRARSHSSDSLANLVLQTPLNKEDYKNSEAKVSVIVPCYNSQDTLVYAITSLLNQSWSNIEIIIVDDHSSDQSLHMACRLKDLDPRIVVISSDSNKGPYACRNLGISAINGQFITVADTDDWNHPQKIEYQVAHLLKNSNYIANCASWFRATSDLTPVRRKELRYQQLNISSLMIRAQPFLDRLGAWDEVRYSGDSELYNRIKKIFGPDSVADLDGITAVSLVRHDSLTHDSRTGYNGYSYGSRRDYRSYYQAFHDKMTPESLLYEACSRPNLLAPYAMLNLDNKELRRAKIIYAGDFRIAEEASKAIDLIEVFSRDPLEYELVQIYSYDLNASTSVDHRLACKLEVLGKPFLSYADRVKAERLVILNCKLFESSQKYLPALQVDSVIACSYDSEQISRTQRKNIACWLDVDPESIQDAHYMSDFEQSLDRSLSQLESHTLTDRKNLFESLQICTISEIDLFNYQGSIRACAVMPCIDLKVGIECARLLLSRAGTELTIIIAIDDVRQGFIKTINMVASRVSSRYIIYLAQDVLPGRNWLTYAYSASSQSCCGLLGFNDGKWNGRIASFGMIDKNWAFELYGGNILSDAYHSHKADNEITVLAKILGKYTYCPESILFENDFSKDVKGGSSEMDDQVFRQRMLNGFDGIVSVCACEKLFKEYKVTT